MGTIRSWAWVPQWLRRRDHTADDVKPRLAPHVDDSGIEHICSIMLRRAHSEAPENKWQPSAVGDCARAILRDYRVEAKGLEPIVRDALEMYALAYTEVDDISRGTLERRAKFANRWMALHGFGMVDTHMDGCGEC